MKSTNQVNLKELNPNIPKFLRINLYLADSV